jgi:hypothetical protein
VETPPRQVLTPDGVSYEREMITQHLQRNGGFDPVTRNALALSDLRSNLAMKAAAEEYLREHPWAAPDVI